MQEKKNAKSLPIVAIIGTAGAGKTEVVSNTFRSELLNEWVYFLNDSGNPDSVNLTDLPSNVDLRPMANGCFSCEDDQQLRELITSMAKLYDEQDNPEIKGIILEGYGFVAGDETASFLEKLELPYSIACIFDAANFRRNYAIYGGVMENQVRAATAGVWISKYPADVSEVADEQLTSLTTFIKDSNPWIESYLLPRGERLPEWVFNPSMFEVGASNHSCENHHCGHDHGSEHSHNHHALSEYHFRLLPEVVIADLRSSLEGSLIVRTKGVVAGEIFHSVYETWEITPALDDRQFITIYCEPGFDPLSINQFKKLVDVNTFESNSTLSLIRSDEVTKEETELIVNELLKSIPDEPVWNSFNQLVTHPEILQIVKEVSRRPSVKEDLYPVVIEECCWYWVKCALQIAKVLDLKERANNLRELSISLGWWAVEYKDSLPKSLVKEIALVRPASMLAEGLTALEQLNSNPEKAYWQVQEILKVCDFAEQSNESPNVIRNILENGMRISNNSSLIDSVKFADMFSARIVRSIAA